MSAFKRTTTVLLAALALVAASCGGSDSAETSTTTAISTTTTSPATTAAPTSDATSSPFGDAELLPTSFAAVTPGSHWTDVLGVPFSFTIGQGLFVQQSGSRGVFMSSPASDGPGDLSLDFLPISSLWRPGQVGLDPGALSAADLVAHLESLEEGEIVSNQKEATIGGRSATSFDIRAEADLGTGVTGLSQRMEAGWTQRIWIIDVGDEPLAVAAGISTDDDALWLDVIEDYLTTMTFDPAAG